MKYEIELIAKKIDKVEDRMKQSCVMHLRPDLGNRNINSYVESLVEIQKQHDHQRFFFCDADADKVLLYDRCINISVHISVHVIFTGQTNANRIKTNNLNKKGSGKSAEVGPSTL